MILEQELSKYFGFSEFRRGQKEIIESILSGNDTLAVMPTGGGKSLCYQLPAILSDGTAIVVSPLIALMKDQVDALNRIEVPSTFINSSLGFEEIQERVSNALQGTYKLLYIAPERLENDFFKRILSQMKISFLAIDEAHCISEWGHDFRPAYLNINKALKFRPIRPIAAFTATAGPEVQEDIVKVLELSKPRRFIKGFDRPNLSYMTLESLNKIDKVIEIIKKTPTGSTIIYCGSRRRVDDYTLQLKQKGFDVAAYHAGLPPNTRKDVQDAFISGEKRIIVATNAFGMGIDKPDVRNVIHCDFTSTLEAYYQEAGRAGRDGLPSSCYLIHHHSDIDLQDFFISSRYPDKSEIEKLYSALNYYADKFRQINQTLPSLANNIDMPLMKVMSILDIFEKNGLIERTAAGSRAKLRIFGNRDILIEYYRKSDPARQIIIEAFMRQVTSEVYEREVDLDIKSLMKNFGVEEADIYDTMRAMSFAGLVEFKPEKESGAIRLLFDNLPLKKLPIDLDNMEVMKRKARLKLDVVVRYSDTSQCKRNFILEYFQDDEVAGECGKCTSCQDKSKKKSQKSKSDFLLKSVLNGLWDIDDRFGKLLLVDYLRGVSSEKTRKFNLSSYDNYGILNDISDTDIRVAVENAVSKGYIKISSGLYPILSLTNNGLDYIKKGKNYGDKRFAPESSEQELLFAKLKNIRSEIAIREGIADRAIATDRSLREIAKNPPANLIELNKIRGISNYAADKYGRIILSAIREEVADEIEQLPKTSLNPNVSKMCNLFEDGKNIEEVASILKIEKGYIAKELQSAIMNEQVELNWRLFVEEKDYNKIKQLIYKKPHITLKSLRLAVITDIDYAVLRIVSAIARKNI